MKPVLPLSQLGLNPVGSEREIDGDPPQADRLPFSIYMTVLILAPLLFGAVHPYAYTPVFLAIFAAALLLIRRSIKEDPHTGTSRFHYIRCPANLMGLMLIAYMFFQIMPLPPSLLGFISPDAGAVGEKSLPAAQHFASHAPPADWFSLAPYRHPVCLSIVRLTAYWLFFMGLVRTLHSRKRIGIAVSCILVTACFDSLYGMGQTYSGPHHIWWLNKLGPDVCGTFINRNHFAGYMGMTLMLTTAYAAALWGRKKSRSSLVRRKTGFEARLSRILLFYSQEQRLGKVALFILCGVVTGVGLLLSASRGGILSCAVGLLLMSFLLLSRRNHRLKGFLILLPILLSLAYTPQTRLEYFAGRFKTLQNAYEIKTRLRQKTIELFHDYKAAGIGIGNFRHAFPRYQSPEDKELFIDHAENDWAQFLSEGGLTGTILLLTGLTLFLVHAIRLWNRRHDSFAVCLGIVPLGVIAAMGAYSFFDFNLHIPANCLTLSATLAIGYAALHLEMDREKGSYRHVRMRYKGILLVCMLVSLVLWTSGCALRHFIAEALCSTVPDSTLNRNLNPSEQRIKAALFWDGGNAAYWFKLACELRRHENLAQKDSEGPPAPSLEVIDALEKAVRLNPFNAEYHRQLGWEYSFLWHAPDDHQKWLSAADLSMERAAYFAGESGAWEHNDLGSYWDIRSKSIDPANPFREITRAKACWHHRKALFLETGAEHKKQRLKEINN